jgi:transcription elongation GreA/GreB family factor
MPVSSLYLLGRAVGYRERARKVRELASKAPADAERLGDLASSLEDKAAATEERAWSVDTMPVQRRPLRLRAPDSGYGLRSY